MRLSETASLIAFKFAWAAGRVIPRYLFITIFVSIGRVVYARNGVSIRRLRFNVARVLGLDIEHPDVVSVSQKAFLNYMRYWAELFCLVKVPNSMLTDHVEIVGLEILQEAQSKGRGVLVVAPHAGNWDLAGAVAAAEFGRLTSVAERLKPEELFQMFVKSREPRGIEILPHKGGDKPAFEVLQERLLAGGLVGMATDRDMSRSGVEVVFFGHTSKMPSGPARLFASTGCAVLGVKVYYSGRKTRIEFLPELSMVGDTTLDTQTMADALAEIITAHPDNWFMLQQIWIDHPVELGGR